MCMYIYTWACTVWRNEWPAKEELEEITSTFSSCSILIISQKIKWSSTPHATITCRMGPVSWISIFGDIMLSFTWEELEQPLRGLFLSIKLSFFSFANFRFVSRLFMWFIASSTWLGNGNANSYIKLKLTPN